MMIFAAQWVATGLVRCGELRAALRLARDRIYSLRHDLQQSSSGYAAVAATMDVRTACIVQETHCAVHGTMATGREWTVSGDGR